MVEKPRYCAIESAGYQATEVVHPDLIKNRLKPVAIMRQRTCSGLPPSPWMMSSAFHGAAMQHSPYDRPANILSWEITFGQTYDRFQDRLAWKLLVSDTISGSSPCLLCVEDKASILLVLYPYTAERRDVLENTPPEAQEISQGRGFCTPRPERLPKGEARGQSQGPTISRVYIAFICIIA